MGRCICSRRLLLPISIQSILSGPTTGCQLEHPTNGFFAVVELYQNIFFVSTPVIIAYKDDIV